MEPQRFLADGIEVRQRGERIGRGIRAECIDLGTQAVQRRGTAVELVQRPRERDRRGLVPGEQQKEPLVAQLVTAHRAAVAATRGHHHVQDVGPIAPELPALRELLEHQRIEGALAAAKPSERTEPAELALQRAQQDQQARRRAQQLDDAAPELRLALRVRYPEGGLQDDVERDRLSGVLRLELRTGRHAAELAHRRVRHDPAVGAHSRAVERRGEQPARARWCSPSSIGNAPSPIRSSAVAAGSGSAPSTLAEADHDPTRRRRCVAAE